MILEICANSAQSAINAQKGGAGRVELCDNLVEGGTTPSAATIQLARMYLDIDVYVLIRPRGGDFVYSPIEFEIIKRDIKKAKEYGANGVVIGLLNPDYTIQTERLAKLIAEARPMKVTFHRAFDFVADPFKSLETLIELGVNRVLTSGQQQTALEGAGLIKELLQKADGKIAIMPGGGIKASNILDVVKLTGATEYHLSARKLEKSTVVPSSKTIRLNASDDIPETDYFLTDPEEVKAVMELLNHI